MPELLKDEDVRNCNVTDTFGSAREWLTYEAVSYYMQLLQLIIILFASEFKAKNIFNEECELNSPERVGRMIDKFQLKGLKNIIVFDDKNDKEFTMVENRIRKDLEMAQYKLENPQYGEDENFAFMQKKKRSDSKNE